MPHAGHCAATRGGLDRRIGGSGTRQNARIASLVGGTRAAPNPIAFPAAQIASMTARRVLHVLHSLTRAGAETWLMHMYRSIDPAEFSFDFLVHQDASSGFDQEILERGSKRIRLTSPRYNLVAYGRELVAVMTDGRPYDIVHCHVENWSGVVLPFARRARVPVRIAHSHTDTASAQAQNGVARSAYLLGSRVSLRYSPTHRLACTLSSGDAVFGPGWHQVAGSRVLYYGIDLSPFAHSLDRNTLLAELRLPRDCILVGHIGRFQPQKNHPFLMQIAASIATREPRARFLFIGDGPLRPDIERRANSLGLADKSRFLGSRDDVPRLMQLMDVLVFPSLYEGLPLVLIEAQAAGLPIVCSDTISIEVDVTPHVIHRLRLTDPPTAWANETLEMARSRIPPELARTRVEASPFTRERSVAALLDIYRDATKPSGAAKST